MTRRVVLGIALGSAVILLLRRSAAGQISEPQPAAEVSGTALGSGRSPTSPPSPLAGLTVVLLPRSSALLDGLERLRRQSRESLAAYRSAVPEMRGLVAATVDELKGRGQAGSIRSSTVDDKGHFTLGQVPPGEWTLIAYRAVHVSTSHDKQRESGTYLPSARLVGYDRVSVWLRSLAVGPGQPQVVELTDRNVWFEGVVEQTVARDRAPTPGGSRRSAR